MDKNSVIGLILIGIILVGYSYLNKPSEEQLAKAQAQRDSIQRVMAQAERERELETIKAATVQVEQIVGDESDSLIIARNKEQFGIFFEATQGNPELVTLENDLVKIVVSTKGGKPISAQIKDFSRYDGSPLILFNEESTVLGLNFFANNRVFNTNNLYFKTVGDKTSINATNQAEQLSMRLYAGENSYIEYLYTITPGKYDIGFTINMVNMRSVLGGNNTGIDLTWDLLIPRQEKGITNENQYTAINYKYDEDEVEEFTATKERQEESVNTAIRWIAFKQQFFSSVLISNGAPFKNADLKSQTLKEDENHLKKYNAVIGLPYDINSNDQSYNLSFYFGPNSYKILKHYDNDLKRLVPLGGALSRFINKVIIIPTFNLLNNSISNYGIIILILTIFIKIVLFPFTYKSYMSMAKMKALKPMIDEINERIPASKAMERQQATANLYKKAGVSPLGGCLPMLLQFPILFAMFRFFPSSIELRQQAFLWADDLSTYDSILNLPFSIPFYGDHVSLFTILMTLATILSTKFNSSSNDSSMPGMKTMMYIMPVMFMFILNNLSAALTYYYFLANIFTLGQNLIFKSIIDEEKLIKEVRASKNKPIKKSNFQMRLEKMARENAQKNARR